MAKLQIARKNFENVTFHIVYNFYIFNSNYVQFVNWLHVFMYTKKQK